MVQRSRGHQVIAADAVDTTASADTDASTTEQAATVADGGDEKTS